MEESTLRSPSSENALQPVFEVLRGVPPEAVCTTYGITPEELQRRIEAYQASRRRAALGEQFSGTKVGRNDPCPCGSGKKYKKCCLSIQEEARKALPRDQIQAVEQQTRARERLEQEVKKGFDLLFSQDFQKARTLACDLLQSYPDDDRLHDIRLTALLADGSYDDAVALCRDRWQVSLEERDYFREQGRHRREGSGRTQLVNFYSPSTWLEKFWIAQRARTYRAAFPVQQDSPLRKLALELTVANDLERFPARQEDGFQVRQEALASLLGHLEQEGTAAIPYLLPLTYTFSWASLFVPGLLARYGSDESLRLLAELSMFRFPYFAQKCLDHLEKFGERAVVVIDGVLTENPAFDELKGGMIKVLGNIRTAASLKILERLTDHENLYLVKWVAEALDAFSSPESQPLRDRARARLASKDRVAGVFPELMATIKD